VSREGGEVVPSQQEVLGGSPLRARGQGHPHERLEAWKKAIQLVTDTYRFCNELPAHQKFVLVPQMQRAAISVPANLAEGSSRDGALDKKHFYTIARASLLELDTLLVVAGELEYAGTHSIDEMRDRISDIARMLHGLITYQKKCASVR
jgi:four helix bundle protein